jgi:hypothetical protein
MIQASTANILIQCLTTYGAGAHAYYPNDGGAHVSATLNSPQSHTISAKLFERMSGVNISVIKHWAERKEHFVQLDWRFAEQSQPTFKTRHLIVMDCTTDVAFQDDLVWARKLATYEETRSPILSSIHYAAERCFPSWKELASTHQTPRALEGLDALGSESLGRDHGGIKAEDWDDSAVEQQVRSQLQYEMDYRDEREAWDLFLATGDSSGLVILLEARNSLDCRNRLAQQKPDGVGEPHGTSVLYNKS